MQSIHITRIMNTFEKLILEAETNTKLIYKQKC